MYRRLLPLLFLCLLFALPPAEIHAAPMVQGQSAAIYQGVVNATANIRSGPGLQYAVVGQAQVGQSLTVVACNADCTWLQLDTGNWIAAFLVDLVSKSEDTTANPTSGRTTGRVIDPDDIELNAPSQAALEIVEQILSYTGLPQSFDLYSANIYNAAAMMVNGKRVILYDPQLIADIENVTDHDWPAVSIFAHEIGHHLAGHTLAKEYNRAFELEADYFSGYILQKMGASLDEAQAVMNLLRDHPNMTDHPPQVERLAAVENGWQEAARQQGAAASLPQFSWFEMPSNGVEGASLPATATVIAALQQARSLHISAENKTARLSGREWSLGFRALADVNSVE